MYTLPHVHTCEPVFLYNTHTPYIETVVVIIRRKQPKERNKPGSRVLRMLELLEDGVHKTARMNHRTSESEELIRFQSERATPSISRGWTGSGQAGSNSEMTLHIQTQYTGDPLGRLTAHLLSASWT